MTTPADESHIIAKLSPDGSPTEGGFFGKTGLHRRYYNKPNAENPLPRSGRAFLFERGAIESARVPVGIIASKERTNGHFNFISSVAQSFLSGDQKVLTEIADEPTGHYDFLLLPILLSLIKVHKYSTLGAHYGFNSIAYLGSFSDKIQSDRPVILKDNHDDTKPANSDSSSRPLPIGHLRAAFGHGNPNDWTTPGFVLMACLSRVTFQNSEKSDNILHAIDIHTDEDYADAMEHLARNINSASPLVPTLHYNLVMLSVSKTVPENEKYYAKSFGVRLYNHVKHVLNDYTGTKSDLSLKIYPKDSKAGFLAKTWSFGKNLASAVPWGRNSSNGNDGSEKDQRNCNPSDIPWGSKFDAVNKPATQNEAKQWQHTLQTLYALELADTLMLRLNDFPGSWCDVLKTIDDDVIVARVYQIMAVAYDLHIPPESAKFYHTPQWPRLLTVSDVQQTASRVATVQDSRLGIPGPRVGIATPMVGNGIYQWSTWLPAAAFRFNFDQKETTEMTFNVQSPTLRATFDYENRVQVYYMMLHYMKWLYVSPEKRLVKAMELASVTTPGREQFFINLGTNENMLMAVLWFMAHFVSESTLQRELLLVFDEWLQPEEGKLEDGTLRPQEFYRNSLAGSYIGRVLNESNAMFQESIKDQGRIDIEEKPARTTISNWPKKIYGKVYQVIDINDPTGQT